MSFGRKTYSPLSHTYSYSSNFTPSYSYSRVTTYLDALQKDQTINKLKRQITNVKSMQVRHQALLQQISAAEKQNRILETKNTSVEEEFVKKIQQTRSDIQQLEDEQNEISLRISQEDEQTRFVEGQIASLLEELKKIKMEEQQIDHQNIQLESNIESNKMHQTNLKKQQEELNHTKQALCLSSKQSTQATQGFLMRITELKSLIVKDEQELKQLQSQKQCFALECQHMLIRWSNNNMLMQDLQRKIVVQQGQNQQLQTQIQNAQQQLNKLQYKLQTDNRTLYQNVIKVQEHSLLILDTLHFLDKMLQNETTQKKYLKDISEKQSMLAGQNQQIRAIIKHLQETYDEKKAQQTALIEEVNKKLKINQILKSGIEKRNLELNKIKQIVT